MKHPESLNEELHLSTARINCDFGDASQYKEKFCDIEKETHIFEESLPKILDQDFEIIFCAENLQSDDKSLNHNKKECWSDNINDDERLVVTHANSDQKTVNSLDDRNMHTEESITAGPPTQETGSQTDKNSGSIIFEIENTALELKDLNRWDAVSEKYNDANMDIFSRDLINDLSPSDKFHGILSNFASYFLNSSVY